MLHENPTAPPAPRRNLMPRFVGAFLHHKISWKDLNIFRRASRAVLHHKISWKDLQIVAILALSVLFGVVSLNLYSEVRSEFPQEETLPDLPPGFVWGTFPRATAAEPGHYALYVPPHLRSRNGPYPLITFLHGYGERVKTRLLTKGLPTAIRNKVKKNETFDFVAFFPVDPKGNWHTDDVGVTTAMETLAYVVQRHNIDPKRIYLTGHSNGGCGVWNMAQAYPDTWAAMAPLCTVCAPDPVKIKDIPCWIFQGDKDKVAPVERARNTFQELKKLNADVRYTEYAGKPHIIWPETYDNQELYDWFLTKVKP